MDRDWWKMYRQEVDLEFKGERFSNNAHPGNFRTTKITQKCYANSGAGAIVTAIVGGAQRVILLGYDCQHTNGQTHWHGDHPKGLGNAARVEKWGDKFAELARTYAKIEILNASRETALTCFPRVELETVL
jgi:hypothetical protein